jgi:hypothetical protein
MKILCIQIVDLALIAMKENYGHCDKPVNYNLGTPYILYYVAHAL